MKFAIKMVLNLLLPIVMDLMVYISTTSVTISKLSIKMDNKLYK